jgi:predicted transposase YbfD/YdcC
MKPIRTSLDEHFERLEDPRREQGRVYPLKTVLILAVIGAICGCNDWVGIAEFCRLKKGWLDTLLNLSAGIPSHDTFRYVFAKLKPELFQNCFGGWINSLAVLKLKGVLAIDGKVNRGSHSAKDGQVSLEMVSAYLSEAGLVIGQKAVPEGSNEIATVPELLKQLVLKHCIVTMDAANCQSQNTRLIVERGGDYVLALKENQGKLFEDVQLAFVHEEKTAFKQVKHEIHTTVETSHGRRETRICTVLFQPDYIEHFNLTGKWWRLASVGRIQRTRVVGNKVQSEIHYFISSLTSSAQRFAQAIRDHWGIENRVHWSLDMTFDEDHARNRVGFQPENFAVLRHFALDLLRLESSYKASLKNKRMRAAIDNDYLLTVLNAARALN